MKYDTKIWHLNINSVTGALCDNLYNLSEWTPALNLRTILISLQGLMSCPIPEDAQDDKVASQYRSDINLYNITAR